MTETGPGYESQLSPQHAETLGRWHRAAYRDLQQRGARDVTYLGRSFHLPDDVFGPTPVSDLLGQAVLKELRPEDRVLDMGTGCGVNAILAASVANEVHGVDLNPSAVEAARANAHKNGVSDRCRFGVSDVFSTVSGRYDLIVFDPPFRWFRPKDLLEASITDAGYRCLTRFAREAADHLNPGGRVLLFFGTSGDQAYMEKLMREEGWHSEVLATRNLTRDGLTVTYSTRRLTRSDRS